MKKFLLIVILLTFLCPSSFGQEKYWDVNENLWGQNVGIIAVVCFDGVEQRTSDIEIAVFNNDELRSNGVRLKYEVDFDRYMAYLTAYGDNSYTMTFKVYDHSVGEILNYTCLTEMQYTIGSTPGSMDAPCVIDFDVPTPPVTFTGEGSWNEVSNWNNSVMPTEEDNVIIDGNAVITDEIVVASLIINSGKSLTIQDGGLLTVTGTLTNTDVDALVIEDGGQIIQTNEDVAATFKKNIVNPTSWNNPKSGWQFISSPMLDAATEDFESVTGDYDLYKFDGGADLQWVNYKKHDDFETEFQQGVGYIASYETQTTASFKGVLNNETEYFDFDISYNSSNDWANFYLLGNPFSFDIDWDLMITSKIEDGFATLDANTGVYIYNVEGSIKVGEGFMIHVKKKNAKLIYENIVSAKSRSVNSDYINIVASNKDASDNVIVRFGEYESAGFPKLDNINDEIANVYTKHENVRYGIYNCDESTKEISIYFDAKRMGTYTLTFDVNGNYENLYLIDKMTGEKVNLLLENEYTFIANSNDNNDRFIILFANSQQPMVNGHFAYVSGKELIVNTDGLIQIVDMMGRVVMTEENRNGSINIGELKNATYIVRCVNENEVKTQKIVVL